MTLKITTILVFGCLIGCDWGQGTSMDDLMDSIFSQKFSNTSRGGETGAGSYKSCGMDKECVPRHLCVDGGILTTDPNLIDIRIYDSVCVYNELCCDISRKTTDPVISPVPPVQHVGCGWRNKHGVGYCITGDTDNESQFGEFPWTVAILRAEDAAGYLYHCGGSLIADNVVLTASHCVINRKTNQLMVRGGEWDTQTTNEILGHVDKRVREIITHENYNKGALYNDVALLILDEPF